MQDGEVPVTVVNPRPRQGIEALGPPRPGVSPQERAEAAEAAMAREIGLREQVERRAQEAEAHLLEVRTKLGHADLARTEAEARLAEARGELTRLRVELDEARRQLGLRAQRRDARVRAAERDPDAPPPRRGRPPSAATLQRRAAEQAAAERLASSLAGIADGNPPRDVPAPRRRGRPPKPRPEGEVPPVPRKRGRPPKLRLLGEAVPAPRKPGRPRKDKLVPLVAVASKPVKWWLRDTAMPAAGKRRGRPPKV